MDRGRRLSADLRKAHQRATHAEVSPEAFKELLRPIGKKKVVVCYVVDVFDFHGSFLNDLTGMLTHTHTNTHTHVCVHVCVCACVRACVCVCVCTGMLTDRCGVTKRFGLWA